MLSFCCNLLVEPSSIVIWFCCSFEWKLKAIKMVTEKKSFAHSQAFCGKEHDFRVNNMCVYNFFFTLVNGAHNKKKYIISVLFGYFSILFSLFAIYFIFLMPAGVWKYIRKHKIECNNSQIARCSSIPTRNSTIVATTMN